MRIFFLELFQKNKLVRKFYILKICNKGSFAILFIVFVYTEGDQFPILIHQKPLYSSAFSFNTSTDQPRIYYYNRFISVISPSDNSGVDKAISL